MQAKVTNAGLGLSKEVYVRKPIHNSNFSNVTNLTNDYFYEPQNLGEEIMLLFNKLKNYLEEI